MSGLIAKLIVAVVLLVSGWLGGSVFPAPEQWTAAIRGRAHPLLDQLDLSPAGLERLRQSLSKDEFAELAQNAAWLASNTGHEIPVEHTSDVLEEHADAVDALRAAPRSSGLSVFQTALFLCRGMTVHNAPAADASNRILNYAARVAVNGVSLAVNPTGGACLASGVGQRGGRLHKGLDLHARDGGPVYAAADGRVIERVYRDDYGNMLLIDHGGGVYTRYGHLSSFAPGLVVGAQVAAGQQVGLMGNTAAYQIPVHLHYELLIGDYDNPRGSFGLSPVSPFDYPAAPGAPIASAPPIQAAPSLGDDSGLPHCAAGPITTTTAVTVRSGDTLSSISRACYAEDEAWRLVASCNVFLKQRNRGGVSPLNGGDLLYIGDRLVLPAPGARCPGT